ncbi:hypothetical protein VOLCADRAFT_103747 [Volvox carteri f. nagariensis]|uniref:Protein DETOXIFICATION n=1 Tax=Volvox carteri f. nagariensis TaxID=3068 RepID=D8TN98_VOLCA|nr:uncharacterized protein VOLCADRAFT_103747 [Volvox carteri f. nagariensis]EFJ50951.1 hypothetical protein VOLCADRAFT_103747 [Volvox carteri f. nagariensis]|eukprot:XP_002947963.1 hypothetical protein VOLCADRAFT_103747 [Volvox carteri f. nagariensis]
MSVLFIPLLLNLTCAYGINLSTLAFVGHLGTDSLAAAALGTSIVGMLGRTVLYGLVGGLDTLASQAYGAGNLAAMGAHFRVATLFLLLHLAPLLALLGALPLLLRREETEEDLGIMAGRYVRLMLPSLIFESFNRPMNSVLVAQRITAPQMIIQVIALTLHISTNYVMIHVLGLGYLGGAVATSCTAAYVLLMTSSYVLCSGLGPRVWGAQGVQTSTWTALRSFGKLSYPACVMKCAESWGFSFMTVAAGKLPDPGTAVSAASISFNIYGVLFMCFSAFAVTTCTQVGNALGAGSARAARHAALTALCTAPMLWVGIATLLVEPHTQRLLTLIFTDGHDTSLTYHLRRMLVLVAALELFDGSQVVMTGVIQGAGKQRLGVLVNVFAFYVAAIPTALVLAFVLQWGVEGMYSGMLLGPAIQAAAYFAIILRLDWREEARRVAAKAAARQERDCEELP